MIRKLFIPALVIGFLLAGCFPVPPATQPPTEGIPPPSGLTLEILRNGTYLSPMTMRTVTLVDGAYSSGTDSSAPDFLQVTIGEAVVFGDLNYDGLDDAAITLAENTGGTGIFVSLLAILNSGGAPFQAASVFIDDRPIVGLLSIFSGEILADLTLHGADDPMCCPSQQAVKGYRLYADQLVLTRLATQTPSMTLRAIDITSPADLADVAYPFTLTGGVTIGPFENTLAYNVYDPANALVTAGSVMTDSPDMGMPGNFTLTLDLTMAGVTGHLRVEFVEYSMADGSIMTLDSVLVNLP